MLCVDAEIQTVDGNVSRPLAGGILAAVLLLAPACEVVLLERVRLGKWGTACETQAQPFALQTPYRGHGEPVPDRPGGSPPEGRLPTSDVGLYAVLSDGRSGNASGDCPR